MLEQVLEWLGTAFQMRSISLRYFNATGVNASEWIGERHHPETYLIPIVLETVPGKRDEKAIFETDYDTPDGTCIHNYIHVEDLAEAYLIALEALEDGHPISAAV